jgi:hypothetical protein
MGINQKTQKNVLIMSNVRRVVRSAIYAQGIAVNPETKRKTVTIKAIQSSEGTPSMGRIKPVMGGKSALAAAMITERMKRTPYVIRSRRFHWLTGRLCSAVIVAHTGNTSHPSLQINSFPTNSNPFRMIKRTERCEKVLR